MLCVATVLAGLCLNAAVVTTLDGKQYEGEAFLEPGNVVTVVLPDSSKRSIPLDQVKSATFSGLMSTDTFGQIAGFCLPESLRFMQAPRVGIAT